MGGGCTTSFVGARPTPDASANLLLLAAILGGSLAVAAGALPLLVSLAVALGVPAALASLRRPKVALALLLFSIPFSSWAKVTVGQFSITSTDVLVALLLFGWIARAAAGRRLVIHSGPSIVLAIALLGAALLSTLTAGDLPDALKELIKLCELIGVALFAATNLGAPSAVRATFWLISIPAAAQAIVGLAQFASGSGPESFAIGPFVRAYGTFEQPNALAGYLGLAFPFALVVAFQRSRAQPWGLACATIILAAIAATLSRGAWLGLALGLAAMGLAWDRTARQWVWAGAIAIAVVLVTAWAGLAPEGLTARLAVFFEHFWVFDARTVAATPENWSLVERMAHWQAGWAIAVDNPAVGIGPGSWDHVYKDYYIGKWEEPLGHAHNFYLNTFAELGAIGLAAFLALAATVFVQIGRGLRATGMGPASPEMRLARALLVAALGATVTFSMHNMFDNMFVHGIGVQVGLILGLIEAQVRVVEGGARAQETHGSGGS